MPTKTRNIRGWFPFALNPTTREFVARGSSSFRIAKVDSTTHRSGARCSVKGLLPCVFACPSQVHASRFPSGSCKPAAPGLPSRSLPVRMCPVRLPKRIQVVFTGQCAYRK